MTLSNGDDLRRRHQFEMAADGGMAKLFRSVIRKLKPADTAVTKRNSNI
jgi:hypothetical protein